MKVVVQQPALFPNGTKLKLFKEPVPATPTVIPPGAAIEEVEVVNDKAEFTVEEGVRYVIGATIGGHWLQLRAFHREPTGGGELERGLLGAGGKVLGSDDVELLGRLPQSINLAHILTSDGSADVTVALQAQIDAAPTGAVFDFGGPQFTYKFSTVNLRSDQTFLSHGSKMQHVNGTNNPMFYHAKATAGTLERVRFYGNFSFEGYGWAENTEEKLKCAIYIVHGKDIELIGPRAKNFLSAAFHVQLAGDVLYDDLIATDCGTPGGRNAIEILGEEEEVESTAMNYDATIRNCKADCAEAFHGGAGGVCLVAKRSQNIRSTMINNRAYNCMNFAGIDCEAGWTRYTQIIGNKAFCCKQGIQNVDTMQAKKGSHVVDRMLIADNITDCKNTTTRTAKNATIEVAPGADMPKSAGIETNGSHTNVIGNIVRSTGCAYHIYENLATSGETDALATRVIGNGATLANTDAANKPVGVFEMIGCNDLLTSGNHVDFEEGALGKDAYYYQDITRLTEGANTSRGASRKAIKCVRVTRGNLSGGGSHYDCCSVEGESAIELAECDRVHVGGGKRIEDTRAGEAIKMKVGVDVIAGSTNCTCGELDIRNVATPVRGTILAVPAFGGTPVAKAAAIASPAAELAALKTAVDKLREAVKGYGITS